MTINKNKHINLIRDELTFQTNEFEKLLRKQAAKMFMDGQLYLCRYQGFDEARGNLIAKFDHHICLPPRKNEHFQCFISEMQDHVVKNWGGLTYKDLRTKVDLQFESRTIFITYTNEHSIVGLAGIKAEDVEGCKKDALMFLAPTDPPLNYILNLFNFLKEESAHFNEVLDLQIGDVKWQPKPLIIDENIVTKIQTDLIENEVLIIQGPPGTGKTYLMAQLCGSLLKANYRILVTALTNRALVELAEKEHLRNSLQEGKIYKSALTADESRNKKISGIKAFKSLSQQKPQMLLSTYYVMSQIAARAMVDDHFDYIIIEEASQAFLSTIALARKLGKKCIIIGDIKQLEPIFHKEFGPEDTNNYHWMVCGLKAISYYMPNTKQYILTDSYRLTPNSVNATNSFYSGMLTSKSDAQLPLNFNKYPILKQNLQSNGGTSLRLLESMSDGMFNIGVSKFIIEIVNTLKQFNPNGEVSVLAFHRATIRFLQKEIFTKCPNTESVLVDTIDRVQGLTTDFSIFYIPTESMPFALQSNRFNVATSRARLCTLLIADKNLVHFTSISEEVSNYLKYISTNADD